MSLAVSLRPKKLSDIIGQKPIKESVINLFTGSKSKNQENHFFIISGNVGSGKTTLARIIAGILQCPELDKEPKLRSKEVIKNFVLEDPKKYDIVEVNASDKNGIDDIRALITRTNYVPMKPSRTKVIIMDEAHQLTTPAQNALLSYIEELPKHVYYIFCTSQLSKLLLSVRRRAFIINTMSLDKEQIKELVYGIYLEPTTENANKEESNPLELDKFINALWSSEINTTGLVIQAYEKYLSGFSIDECTVLTASPTLDKIFSPLCKALLKGSWDDCSVILKEVGNSDTVALKNIILGYLKKVLLGSPAGLQSVRVAKAIKAVNESTENSADFIASVCLACNAMNMK